MNWANEAEGIQKLSDCRESMFMRLSNIYIRVLIASDELLTWMSCYPDTCTSFLQWCLGSALLIGLKMMNLCFLMIFQSALCLITGKLMWYTLIGLVLVSNCTLSLLKSGVIWQKNEVVAQIQQYRERRETENLFITSDCMYRDFASQGKKYQ